ncbi:MAG: hypothetical protein K0R94_1417 [Burkholderiales bacterium]|jgi:hypothetical protein|nr:hypothetical protein [Burkholderiales bacterium]
MFLEFQYGNSVFFALAEYDIIKGLNIKYLRTKTS